MKHIRKGFALVCILALVLQLFSGFPAAYAAQAEAAQPESAQPQTLDSAAIDAVFLSDLHNGLGGYGGLIQMMDELDAEGVSPRVLSHGGDYVEDDRGGQVDWQTQVYDVITGIENSVFPAALRVYTLGNHDWEDGTFGGRTDKEAAFEEIFGFPRCGVVYSDAEMEIYMIGAQNKTGTGGGGEGFDQADIDAFDAYLTTKENSRKVIFLQTHWPAHSSYNWKQRVVTNADVMIDMLNSHAENLDIVWLWGHNHYEDTMRYEILLPGDQIMYSAAISGSAWNNPKNPQYKTIQFIYANAACMNDMKYLTNGLENVSGPDYRGPAACLSVAVEDETVTFWYNRIQKVNDVWTYSHDANVTIHNQLFEHPATVVAERRLPSHEHSFAFDHTVEPTCTEEGYDLWVCQSCGAEDRRDPTPALGHDWDRGVVLVPASTASAGQRLRPCTRCPETVTEAIPRLPGVGPADIDFTDPEDAVKYAIDGQNAAAVTEGVGVKLLCAEGESAGPRDRVRVPVSGDWTATVKLRLEGNHVPQDGNSRFAFLAAAGEDGQNLAGLRWSDAALESCLRQAGADAEPVAAGPGFYRNAGYWLRLQKAGDDYSASWSADGERFSLLFTLEDTGIEAEYLILDAEQSGGAWESWQILLKSLNFRWVELPAERVWTKADGITLGERYVSVADGPYAMNNTAVPAKETYSGSTTTLGAVPVTVEDGVLRTAVSEDLLWTFRDSQGFQAYDGEATYLLYDTDGKLLRRTSMGRSNAGLVLDSAMTQNTRYYTWSFKEYEGTEAVFAMYANSERAYGTDYPGRVGANSAGFDIPGGLSQRSSGDPFAFMSDAACARISLYRQTDALDLLPLMNAIHEAHALEPGAYTPASAEALANAVAAAEAALSEVSTQEELAAAVEALNGVMAALEPGEPFRFTDVRNENSYYYTPVYWAYGADPQITSGVSEKLFGPGQVCTRAQVVTFLWRAAGSLEPMSAETGFTDVGAEAYYSRAVAWALEAGITSGVAPDRFQPEAPCTRAQIVTFLWRYAGSPAPQSTETAFEDVNPAAWYAEPVAWAYETGLTAGVKPTRFAPGGKCTRAQTVTFLWLLENME